MYKIKATLLAFCILFAFWGCKNEENVNAVDEAQALEELEPAQVEKLLVDEAAVNNAEALQIVKGINNIVEVQYATFTTVVEANDAVIEEQDGGAVAVRRSGEVVVSVRFDGEDVLWVTEIKGVEVMTVRRLENNDLEISINDQSGSLEAKVQDGELNISFADNVGNKFTIIERNGGTVRVVKNDVVLQNG